MGLIELLQNDLGMTIQQPARRRRHDSLAAAEQELGAKVGLQCGDLLTERRLSDTQRIRRTREAAGIDHSNERLEAPRLHLKDPLASAISDYYGTVAEFLFLRIALPR